VVRTWAASGRRIVGRKVLSPATSRCPLTERATLAAKTAQGGSQEMWTESFSVRKRLGSKGLESSAAGGRCVKIHLAAFTECCIVLLTTVLFGGCADRFSGSLMDHGFRFTNQQRVNNPLPPIAPSRTHTGEIIELLLVCLVDPSVGFR
jgi:hypothetical protein